MKKSSFIYVAVVAVGAVASYFYADKKRKELSNHKDAVTAGYPDLNGDIQKASLANENLDMEDRIKAKEVLEFYRVRVNNASTIKDFDTDFQKLTSLLEWIRSGDKEAAVSLINYEHRILLKKQQDREKERDRIADLEKVKALGVAFGRLIPDVNVAPVIKNCIEGAAKS